MNAELLAMLGGAAPPSAPRREEPKSVLSFKAGKMTAELKPVSQLPKDCNSSDYVMFK